MADTWAIELAAGQQCLIGSEPAKPGLLQDSLLTAALARLCCTTEEGYPRGRDYRVQAPSRRHQLDGVHSRQSDDCLNSGTMVERKFGIDE